MTPDQIPQELLDIVDSQSGKVHSRTGLVAGRLAEVLTRYEQMLSGHELARTQITKHGKDRYPTSWQQAFKVRSELGELIEELARAGFGLADGRVSDRIRDEFADTGLAYFELGNKLGLDAIEEMRRLVAADRRTFA